MRENALSPHTAAWRFSAIPHPKEARTNIIVVAVTTAHTSREGYNTMNILVAVIAIIAIILLITGGISSSLSFLIWVGVVLLVIALIVFLLRFITGRRV
ncbi:hypothetical protein GCM10011399_19480 [Subtercola lobariae]|uniref:Uncharacterized protein n=2 Tax=Subtercola lobariae TaxID=1588641 RepID=A0A917EWD8_9MICO|nr:hypothetical protein GCM10011399_19480 [Subtercola lobariae]